MIYRIGAVSCKFCPIFSKPLYWSLNVTGVISLVHECMKNKNEMPSMLIQKLVSICYSLLCDLARYVANILLVAFNEGLHHQGL